MGHVSFCVLVIEAAGTCMAWSGDQAGAAMVGLARWG